MEELLSIAAGYIALALEAISVLVVAFGGIEAVYRMLQAPLRGYAGHAKRRDIWLSLVRWLLLGLEFMLAADIVRSTITPDWDDIAKLAAIAAIRTFLNYFLERDLEAASHIKESE